jgi:hypothetical protein
LNTATPPGSENVIPTNVHHPHVLQDYLETLAAAADTTSAQDHKLLFGYAEMKYRMAGGGKCAMCRSAVRHVVPVFTKHDDGKQLAYECLCQRCLLGEIGLAAEVELRIGDASVRYTRNADKAEPVTRTFVPPKAKSANGGSA